MAPQVWPLGLPPSPVFSSPSPAGGCRDQWGPLKPQRSPWKAGACVPERVHGAEATPAAGTSTCTDLQYVWRKRGSTFVPSGYDNMRWHGTVPAHSDALFYAP